MAEDGGGEGSSGEDPRIKVLEHYCLKTLKQVSDPHYLEWWKQAIPPRVSAACTVCIM